MDQTAISAAPNKRMSETPLPKVLRLAVQQGGRAADRAVWPVGCAGTAAPSGWMLGPELTLTNH
eukprot:15330669-Alexandrium_andersonii.AAC.1